jgi:DNA polymerase I
MAAFGLPYKYVWAIDFEYVAQPGSLPDVVCMVARELGSDRLIRTWQGEFKPNPPFDVGDDALFVAYTASAEMGCFMQLGWPMPTNVLDLYVEFRNETNGLALPHGRGLLGALSHHALSSITKEEKQDMRDLVLAGGPWTDQQRLDILAYCQSDADSLGPLLERMLPRITARPNGLSNALLRGAYMKTVAVMEHNGVPIDAETLNRLRANWTAIKTELIREVDRDYRVYDGDAFRAGRFDTYLASMGINNWPRSDTGMLLLDKDTFKSMAESYPFLRALRELRVTLSELRLEKLQVGPDGRNRVMLSPFGASSGRNTPSATKYIFGPSTWLRSLIQPAEGRAVAYVDWSSQEVWIAAYLSKDPAMLAACESGDPYLGFAVQAGLAPKGATEQSHSQIRDRCKAVVLGVNYGMGPRTLASRIGLSIAEAQNLISRMERTFPVYTEWVQQVIGAGIMRGSLSTCFGWSRLTASRGLDGALTLDRTTAIRNWPMQSAGAEMLRLACNLIVEQGIMLCAPIHDAVLVESETGSIDEVVALTRDCMATASATLLDGLVIGTKAAVVTYPGRYADKRGIEMWDTVIGSLDRLEREADSAHSVCED